MPVRAEGRTPARGRGVAPGDAGLSRLTTRTAWAFAARRSGTSQTAPSLSLAPVAEVGCWGPQGEGAVNPVL